SDHGGELAREQRDRGRRNRVAPAIDRVRELAQQHAARGARRARRARLDQHRRELRALEDAQDLFFGARDLDSLVRPPAHVAGSIEVARHQMWSASVTARTSSTVVTRSRIFLMPLLRSVITPSERASVLIWSSFEPSSTMRRIGLVSSRTSNTA